MPRIYQNITLQKKAPIMGISYDANTSDMNLHDYDNHLLLYLCDTRKSQ